MQSGNEHKDDMNFLERISFNLELAVVLIIFLIMIFIIRVHNWFEMSLKLRVKAAINSLQFRNSNIIHFFRLNSSMMLNLSMSALIVLSSLEYPIFLSDHYPVIVLMKYIFIVFLIASLIFRTHWDNLYRELSIFYLFILQSMFGMNLLIFIMGVIIKRYNLYNFNYIEKFEIILLIILHPILMIILCALHRNYIKWILNHSKQLIIVLYLFVWIWFGTFYFYIAQRASDGVFVFSEQSKVETVLKGILKDYQYDRYDESRLKNIIVERQYQKDYLKLSSNEYITLDQTGNDWGEIYENMFGKDNYSFYSFETSPEVLVIDSSLMDYDSLNIWKDYIGKEFIEVTINLYKTEERFLNSQNSVFYYQQSQTLFNNPELLNRPEKKFKLYFDKNELKLFLDIFSNERINTHLSYFISHSHTMLDGKFIDMYISLNNYINYQIEDFWYFSAVIITTLGFGDITPNSTTIRMAVMMETLLGVILIGVYVSLITNDKKKKR